MEAEDRKVLDAYLGAGIRRQDSESSLLRSSSRWLNNSTVRDVVATWLLRKNGPDFPVEADHTLGLSPAMQQVQPDAEINALFEEERRINPELDAWFSEAFIPGYTNEDFNQYDPGTVGGILGFHIRERGFDVNQGIDLANFDLSKPLDYWRVRSRQTHDFDHILMGGQFNSIGEIIPQFGRSANHFAHLSPALASAVSAYTMFAGMRMISRSLLHYPETWLAALANLEQAIRVGRDSPPIWFFRLDEIFHLTPAAAREHLGMPDAPEIECMREAAIFREEPALLAFAAE